MAGMTPKQKTWATLIVGAVIALASPLFAYLQARQEIREKYKQANAEADAGYKTLVQSVKELQLAARDQHEQLAKLQGYIQAIELLSRSHTVRGPQPATGSGSASVVLTRPSILFRQPQFKNIPTDLTAARKVELTKP